MELLNRETLKIKHSWPPCTNVSLKTDCSISFSPSRVSRSTWLASLDGLITKCPGKTLGPLATIQCKRSLDVIPKCKRITRILLPFSKYTPSDTIPRPIPSPTPLSSTCRCEIDRLLRLVSQNVNEKNLFRLCVSIYLMPIRLKKSIRLDQRYLRSMKIVWSRTTILSASMLPVAYWSKVCAIRVANSFAAL